MIRNNLIRLGVLFLVFTITAGSALAQDESVKKIVSIGMAGGQSPQARDVAINDALRNAVEQGVGTYISSETIVEQMTLVEDRIYSESRGYITSYDIIEEGVKEGVYQVKISAVVKMEQLAEDLESIGLLIRKKQNPRVMVIVFSKEAHSPYWGVIQEGNRNAENQIESKLMAKGFQVVDAGQVKRKKELETLLLQGDPSMASKTAKDFGAEILVEANVTRDFVHQKELFGRLMRFFSNEIRVKALETDTAKIMFSGYRTRPHSGAQALVPLEEATSELVDEMIAVILEQWRKDVYQAGSYQLSLTGASFEDISSFKKDLREIRGLSDVQTRSFQSGIALLEVKYQGPLEELVEKINQTKKTNMEIVGFQANTVDIKIRH
ncbi:MAG: hypothetical protein JRJ47_05750 [Deltaproteobacteria bacterium]|nr:hypothetical protein [Deltaproteobacteria bacterium]